MPSNYLPHPWGAPRLYKGISGGAVWLGEEPASEDDIKRLLAAAGKEHLDPWSVEASRYYDERTLVGLRLPDGSRNPEWTTYYEEMTAKDAENSPWVRFRRWMGW